MLTNSENNTNENAEKTFLNELKCQYERDLDLKKTLDNKATNMITVASSIVTLNIAIGTFLISKINGIGAVYFSTIAILFIVIGLALFSISRFISSYALRGYQYPFGHELFFEKNEYNVNLVEKVRGLPERELNDRLFKGYLKSIKTCAELNDDKATGIRGGQKVLIVALIGIAFLIGLILILTGSGIISLKL